MNSLDSFLLQFTNEKIEYVKRGKQYFFITPELKKIEENIQEVAHSGIILGEEKEKFKPSIYFLELLSEKTKNKVFVNDKAEWLFLCGRDVLPESIVNDSSTSELFLVQNLMDENLGLGKKVKRDGKAFIRNIIDRGDFLRRERY